MPAAVTQVIAAFDDPEGAILSKDGNAVFISNAAEIGDRAEGMGWTEGEGYIVGGELPAPVDTGLGALDGLDFTDGGAMLNTQIKPDVEAAIYVHCQGGKARVLQIDNLTDQIPGPADLAVYRQANGTHLVVIPKLTARDARPGDDEVTVLMPPDFEAGLLTSASP